MRMRAKTVPALLLVLLAAQAGARPTGAAGSPAAPPCTGINLEKIAPDMTRAQVEALNLGKIELLGQTSDEVRLQVRRSKGHETIRMLLHHDRVVSITMEMNMDKAAANALLADLKGHWGEPEKVEDANKGRTAWTILIWSRRDCPVYGAYIYNGGSVLTVLSPSPDVLRYFRDPQSELPEIIR